MLAVGAVAHALRAELVVGALALGCLDSGQRQGLRALWHSDTSTQLVLAALFAWTASARRPPITRGAVAVLALVPLLTAAALYVELGAYEGGHSLMLAAALALLAVRRPRA